MKIPPKDNKPSSEDALREHSFDGIQEYDKRLPNWWLLTFYGGIIFAIGYWFYYAQSGIAPTDQKTVEVELARIEAVRLAESVNTLDDTHLWQMSRNANFVSAGEATFKTTCASCHGEKLTGGIGPNLTDRVWLHGGRPTAVYETVTKGVLVKGMPSWGPVLGAKKISEVVAFILSHHDPAEPEMATESTATETAAK